MFFSELCSRSKTDVMLYLSKEIELRIPSPAKSNMASKLARLAKLWISFGKSLVLHGVIIDGQILQRNLPEPWPLVRLGNLHLRQRISMRMRHFPSFNLKVTLESTHVICKVQTISHSSEQRHLAGTLFLMQDGLQPMIFAFLACDLLILF